MKSDTAIKHEGFKILREKLDPVEFERFIVLLKRENFDYTQWRQDLFENMTVEELSEKADKFSKSLNNK